MVEVEAHRPRPYSSTRPLQAPGVGADLYPDRRVGHDGERAGQVDLAAEGQRGLRAAGGLDQQVVEQEEVPVL